MRGPGALTLAEMAGAASTNDAWKLVRPAQDGRGLIAAMHGCLADAEASPGDVDMILSSTANTEVDDRLEAAAFRSVFGDATPPVASTKGDIGHAMGAAAMFDVALAVEMLRRGRVPVSLDAAGTPAGDVGSILCTGIGLKRNVRRYSDQEGSMVKTAPAFPGAGRFMSAPAPCALRHAVRTAAAAGSREDCR